MRGHHLQQRHASGQRRRISPVERRLWAPRGGHAACLGWRVRDAGREQRAPEWALARGGAEDGGAMRKLLETSTVDASAEIGQPEPFAGRCWRWSNRTICLVHAAVLSAVYLQGAWSLLRAILLFDAVERYNMGPGTL